MVTGKSGSNNSYQLRIVWEISSTVVIVHILALCVARTVMLMMVMYFNCNSFDGIMLFLLS